MEKTTTRKTTLIVGFNDKDTKTQLLSDTKILNILIGCVAEFYEGATFSSCTGMYKGMPEKSEKIEILYSDAAKDAALIEYIKKALNQEAIYLQVEKIAACFA